MIYKLDVKTFGESDFSGHVEIDMPNYIERKRTLKTLGIKIDTSGKANFAEIDPIDLSINMVELCGKQVRSVEIKLSDATEIKSWEQLLDDPRCDKIIEGVSQSFFQGVTLGKN